MPISRPQSQLHPPFMSDFRLEECCYRLGLLSVMFGLATNVGAIAMVLFRAVTIRYKCNASDFHRPHGKRLHARILKVTGVLNLLPLQRSRLLEMALVASHPTPPTPGPFSDTTFYAWVSATISSWIANSLVLFFRYPFLHFSSRSARIVVYIYYAR